MEDIQVSVVCNTYNHKAYIRDALESFLMQKCNFPFEIIVHDDCSTDGTQEILKEYEGKHENLVILYEEENLTSKGIYHFKERTLPVVRGKYIAICEGDDYWTNPLKLQKQFDALEAHPELNMCAHGSDIVDANSGKILYKIRRGDHDRIIPMREVVYGEFGEPVFLATASFFYRKAILDNPPPFANVMHLDLVTQLNGAYTNGIYYIAECMSDYRWWAIGSWTTQMRDRRDVYKRHCDKKIEMFKQFDIDTSGAYHTEVTYRILCIEMLFEDEEFPVLQKKYKLVYDRYSPVGKLKIHIKKTFPWVQTLWDFLHRRMDK